MISAQTLVGRILVGFKFDYFNKIFIKNLTGVMISGKTLIGRVLIVFILFARLPENLERPEI